MAAKKYRVLVLLVYALTTGAAAHYAQDSSMREVGRRDWAAEMPDGEGKGLVLGACTQCHSLNSTVLQRKTAEAWGRSVRDMVARGAQLQPDEIGVVASYLSRNFGPQAPPPSSGEKPAEPRVASRQITAKDLPEEPIKAALLRACTQCHGLDKIAGTRKSEAGWQANLKDMVRLGARLRPDEMTVLVAYLANHFGLQSQQARRTTDADRAQGPAGQAKAADPAQMLPDSEGKGLILGNCVQCHSIRYVTEIRKDAGGWRRTVTDMIARGAQITKEEAEIIVQYLGEHRARR
jgi:mono/diheme cytochrome c family protein